MTLTHLDTLGWLVFTWILYMPCMEDTPASLGNTWKVWTHLETLNTGAMEPLMDSSRQLLWILPDNSYGFFQTTLMDSSRQLPWISMTHDLTDKDVSGKLSSWQEHWLKDQMPVPYPIALENVEPRYPWSWSHILLSSSPGSTVQRTLSFWTLLCGEHNGNQTCTAVMDRRHRFWINDIRDGVHIWWSHQEPYGQWVNPPGPPQYHNWQYLWSTHGLMSSKKKITVIKKMVFV